MHKLNVSIQNVIIAIVAFVKRPRHLLACFRASRQPVQDSNYCIDDGRYEVVSVDIGEASSLNILINTGKLKCRSYDEGALLGKLIDSKPWTVHIIDDDLLSGMWEFRLDLAHCVTVDELWRGLRLGFVSIETTVQNNEIKYFIVVNRGNDSKWKLHLLQQEWKRYQASRQEEQLSKPEKQMIFAR